MAGINTLSFRFRQAANYSIPVYQMQSFLDASLKTGPADDLSGLNARVASFVAGLNNGKEKAVSHIAKYLSNACIGENAEYALTEMIGKASQSELNAIEESFIHSPVGRMTHAVAWTVENALKPKSGKKTITADPAIAAGSGKYTVNFNVNGKTIVSEWVNEYGIWRIMTFGNFAAADKTLLAQKRKKWTNNALVTEPAYQYSAGVVFNPDLEPAFGLEIKKNDNQYNIAFGIQGYSNEDYSQLEFLIGLYYPIKTGKAAFTPFMDYGLGLMFPPAVDTDDSINTGRDFQFGGSIKGGLQFTTSAVPGLYLQMAYQRNFYTDDNGKALYPNMVIASIGYSYATNVPKVKLPF